MSNRIAATRVGRFETSPFMASSLSQSADLEQFPDRGPPTDHFGLRAKKSCITVRNTRRLNFGTHLSLNFSGLIHL